ncbi:hypothetical protein AKJ09_06830 [Labilithrix luteola]|uniref:Uncharacterized protein n=1 Tax=Labilithrix luteola TaxID=1391654 RepID=A0A0K1Q3F8_9BACT|nr:hypothetical protein AKJ09_06830 [Labilithrix luteola]
MSLAWISARELPNFAGCWLSKESGSIQRDEWPGDILG